MKKTKGKSVREELRINNNNLELIITNYQEGKKTFLIIHNLDVLH